MWFSYKSLKVANVPYIEAELATILKTIKNPVLFQRKNIGFSEKKSYFFKNLPKGSKFAEECDWKSKTSQNVQNLVLLNKINRFFVEKFWFF